MAYPIAHPLGYLWTYPLALPIDKYNNNNNYSNSKIERVEKVYSMIYNSVLIINDLRNKSNLRFYVSKGIEYMTYVEL